MQIFWSFQIEGVYEFLYYNSPSLLLYIVFRYINTEGQGNNIAAHVMLTHKNFKSLTNSGTLEDFITLQWKELSNTNSNTATRGLCQ